MIYSLNIKNNVMFEVIKDTFALNSEQLSNEFLTYFNQFKNIIDKTNIPYSELGNCLTPSNKKNEICLIFDTLKIENSWYGKEIFDILLPLFDKSKIYNILYGDLLDYTNNKFTDKVLDLMCETCEITRVNEHKFTNRYFLIYINNLSNTDFEKFSNLHTIIPSFIGCANMTNSSLFKSYISNCISSGFILYKNNMICGHEPDIENISNRNMPGFSFRENGYNIVSISDDYYSIFLDYLIDSSISIWKTDKKYKELLSDIISHGCDLENFNIILKDEKLNYLITEKNIDMRFNNPPNLKEEILFKIANCLKNNIFYRLDFTTLQYKIIKFNVYIDVDNKKITCSVKYNIESKNFEIITMF